MSLVLRNKTMQRTSQEVPMHTPTQTSTKRVKAAVWICLMSMIINPKRLFLLLQGERDCLKWTIKVFRRTYRRVPATPCWFLVRTRATKKAKAAAWTSGIIPTKPLTTPTTSWKRLQVTSSTITKCCTAPQWRAASCRLLLATWSTKKPTAGLPTTQLLQLIIVLLIALQLLPITQLRHTTPLFCTKSTPTQSLTRRNATTLLALVRIATAKTASVESKLCDGSDVHWEKGCWEWRYTAIWCLLFIVCDLQQ